MHKIIAALISLSMPTAVLAQQRQIDVPATARWQHARSGVILPRQIGNYPRQTIVENIPGEVDVIAQYQDESTRISVILYRPQNNDVGFWFDRAEQSLGANPMLAGLAPTEAEPRRFATAVSPTMSGLRQSYRSTGRWRATGTAIFPTGRWLVKVRASSSSLDSAAIDALLDAAIAAIRTPADAVAAPEARIVSACPDTVRWRTARVVAPSTEDALIGGVLSMMANNIAAGRTDTASEEANAGEADAPLPAGLAAPTLCRDAVEAGDGKVYRVPGDSERYWIGLGDSGDFVVVAPSASAALMGGDEDRRSVTLVTPTRTLNYSGFNRLPAPSQVVQMVQRNRPISATGFDPEMEQTGRTTIEIGVP